MRNKSAVYNNQQPLMELYAKDPKAAWITDVAEIDGTNLDDPFHTKVSINEELKVNFPAGVHRAVGGLHDAPNPGDILCASLAVCFETTLRMVANRLGIELLKTKVKVSADVDVRGTLMMSRDVPVGFQRIKVEVSVQASEFTKVEMIQKLLKVTEHCCIIYQTLKSGVDVKVKAKILHARSKVG